MFGQNSLKLTFTSLMGYSTNFTLFSNSLIATVGPGKREIIKLTPVKSAGSYSYQYRYQYFPGIALQKVPDSSFAYLLPARAGNQLRISGVSSLSETFGPKKEEHYYGTGFTYQLADTICASRGGTVYDCNDKIREGETADVFFKSGRNKIAIQHKDGTLAEYMVLAPIHLLVKPGDYVYPGQPMAVFSMAAEKYTVLFSIWYSDEKKIMSDHSDSRTSSLSYLVYMQPHFYVGENSKSVLLQLNKEYNVQHPVEIITAEMSKKVKKKLGYL